MRPDQRAELLGHMVDVMSEVRLAYMRTTGFNALKHWDQLQTRMRLATRTSATVGEWITAMSRGLQLGVPSSDFSRQVANLETYLLAETGESAWLDWLEAEYALVLAHVRLRAEKDRAEREALAALAVNPEPAAEAKPKRKRA